MLSVEYWIVLLLILVSIVSNRYKISLFSFFFLLFLAVFRSINVGTDTLGYYDDYVIMNHMSDQIYHRFEPGFKFLILIFKSIFGNGSYLIFISFCSLPIFIGFWKMVKYFRLSFSYALFFFVTLGYCFFSFNIIRQMLAIGLILCFINLLIEKKYFSFAIVVVVISFLFHNSSLLALFFIPVHFFIIRLDESSKLKYVLCVVLLLSLIISLFFSSFIRDLFLPFSILLNYDGYILGWGETLESNFNIFQTLFGVVIILFLYHNSFRFEFFQFAIGIVLYNFFSIFTSQTCRLSYYFLFFAVPLFSSLISYYKNSLINTRCHVLLFSYSLIIFINMFYFKNVGEVSPYEYNFIRF